MALESVGRAVLGYSFDPLDSAYNNPYTSAIKELMCVHNGFAFSVLLLMSPQPDHLLSLHRATICTFPRHPWSPVLPAEAGGMDSQSGYPKSEKHVGRDARGCPEHPAAEAGYNRARGWVHRLVHEGHHQRLT